MNNEIISWNVNFRNIFKCRVDHDNKINVYYINSFGSEQYLNDYCLKIVECVKLFDNNTYPVILINSYNGGGTGYISQILLELLCPTVSFNIYAAMRKTHNFHNSSEFNGFLTNYANSENCEELTYEYLTKKNYTINYGDNILDTLTEPFILLSKDNIKQINNIKKQLKNPRKPTDILVFTDGYSYSATAIFLKYFQYYGGGITVGYFYNPYINAPLDSGLSPTILYDNFLLRILSPEGYKPFYDKYKFNLKIPGIQIFYSPNNLSNPLEYEITPIDEKVEIYEHFNDNNYYKFINESLKILNKYKNKCNPNNTKLVLTAIECDKNFENKYTHGGYKCGEDGAWSNICVPSYCDFGYIFDHNKQKCIIDVCSEREEEKGKDDEGKNNKNDKNDIVFFYLVVGIALISIIFITIIICIFLIKKLKNTKTKQINIDDEINFEENINTEDDINMENNNIQLSEKKF